MARGSGWAFFAWTGASHGSAAAGQKRFHPFCRPRLPPPSCPRLLSWKDPGEAGWARPLVFIGSPPRGSPPPSESEQWAGACPGIPLSGGTLGVPRPLQPVALEKGIGGGRAGWVPQAKGQGQGGALLLPLLFVGESLEIESDGAKLGGSGLG